MTNTTASDPAGEVLAELQRLMAAVARGGQEGPGGRQRPDPLQASVALDYLALQELLGKQDPSVTDSRFVSIARKPGSLRLFDLPDRAEEIAVFTGPGAPAEIVALGSQHAPTKSTSAYHDVTLSIVPDSAVITRLEVRHHRRVIRLGPRLDAS